MDLAWFWVIDFERLVVAVLISYIYQLTMQLKNVIHQVERELGDIFSISFTP